MKNQFHRRRSDKTLVLRIILVVIVLAIFSAMGFFYFRIKSKGREILREAKNVNMALVSTEIERYAKGEKVYDPTKPDNLADGVKDEVLGVAGATGDFSIVSFDSDRRRVRRLTYFNQGYYAIYDYDNDTGDHWTVSYLLPVIDFTE